MMKLELKVTWVVTTPLNIAGAPGDVPLVDTPLLRRYEAHRGGSEVLLPASTIKGKLRGEAERLVQTLRVPGRFCRGRSPDAMCPACWWGKTDPAPDYRCLLCCLFGSPWHPAALQFSDVTATDLRDAPGVVRPGVGLSRARGTAQEDLLFFVETTPPLAEGISFGTCDIGGEVPQQEAAALLWIAAQQVAAIGNGRSRGRGWLRAAQTSLTVAGDAWNVNRVGSVLRAWLELPGADGGGEHRG